MVCAVRAGPLVRFMLVGGAATLVQSVPFLAAGSVQLANLIATTVATALANELHRRVTFQAGDRTSWLRAQ